MPGKENDEVSNDQMETVEEDGVEPVPVAPSRPALAVQDLSKLDVNKLTPLSPEVISRQATINIGTIGHVAHGKSTVVKALSEKSTVRFKNELERNITIKLGYANAKIFKCDNEECERPGCFTYGGSASPDQFPCRRSGRWSLSTLGG